MSLLPNGTNADYNTTYFVKKADFLPQVSTLISSLTTPPSQWALYPAVSSVNFMNNAVLSTSVVEIDGYFLTAGYQELLLDGVPIATSTTLSQLSSIQDWALYEAISTIDCGNNKITNCTSIQVDGSVITTAGNNILVNATNPVNLWANFQASSNVDVNSRNINNANQLNFITAVPGPGTTGATINALNSLNFSYATGLALQAGINNLNNIAFWNPRVPGVPGAYVNLYSKSLTYGGLSDTFLATDTKLSVPALYTNGLLGSAGGKIECRGEAATYLFANGNACPGAWSQFNATQSVNLNNNQILECRQIDFQFANPGGPFNLLSINANGDLTTDGELLLPTNQWATQDASQAVNMNNFGLNTVSEVTFNGAGHTLNTNGNGDLLYNGQIINTGTGGNVANWARYQANSNVVIPADYFLSINGENALAIYKDSHLNTNIYHGVAGNASAPDFISFPNTFQVGTTINPAREITMTAGALGFGINSDTEVNIDATALVNVYSEGVVSIESITDFNLTASLTTFELGEFNVAALATTFEVASFDVASAGNLTLAGTVTTMTFGATTIATGALGLTTAAAVLGVASYNLTSAGNVTTVGTQIGFTAGTTFDTLSAGNTNLVANDTMFIQGTNAINLTAPVVNASKVLKASTINANLVLPNTNNTVSIPVLNVSTITGIGPGNISPPRTAAVYYNPGTGSLFYDSVPFGVSVNGSSTFALDASYNEQAFILTGTSPINFTTTGLAGVASGFYITIKNGKSSGGGNDLTIQQNGVTVGGPTSGILYSASSTANASICYLLWNGTNLTLY